MPPSSKVRFPRENYCQDPRLNKLHLSSRRRHRLSLESCEEAHSVQQLVLQRDCTMSSSRASRKVKSEDDEVKKEDDDYQSALSAEEISDDPVQPRRKKAKGEETQNSTSVSVSIANKVKKSAPVSFETFQADDSVSFHLVIKDAKGNELKEVQLKKHKFNSGSYGWNLDDKAIIDDGQGSNMTVSLHSNCTYYSN